MCGCVSGCTNLGGHLCSFQDLIVASSATGCFLFAHAAEWPAGSARVEPLDPGPRAFTVVTYSQVLPRSPPFCTRPAVLRMRGPPVPSPAQCVGFYVCHFPPGNWFYWRAPGTSGRKGSPAALTRDSPRSGCLASPGAVHPERPRSGAHCCRAHWALGGVSWLRS